MTLLTDRRSQERAQLDPRDLLADPDTRVLELAGDRALVEETDDPTSPRLVVRAAAPGDADLGPAVFLGRDDDGRAVVALLGPNRDDEASAGEGPGTAWSTLREVGPWLPHDEVDAFMAAQGMAGWHRTHRFCPRCGAETTPGMAGWVRRCPEDEREIYPRTDPAVIMAVVDDTDRLLLGRAPSWPENRRSVLAGFVEPGESLEDAVRREVAEEVGVVVGDVAYSGSQPWPFPASLMVGFVGRAQSADIRCDPTEIAEAEWYTRDTLRAAVSSGDVVLPGRLSIARRLIEGWVGEPVEVPGVDDRGGPAWHRSS